MLSSQEQYVSLKRAKELFGRSSRCWTATLESKFYRPCNNHEFNYGMCYYKSADVPRLCDCPPIKTFQLPKLQPQWQAAVGGARHVVVTKQEVSGKASKPRPGGSRIQLRSVELQAAHWCGWALVSVVLHCLGFPKTNSYWKGTVRNTLFLGLLYRISSKK